MRNYSGFPEGFLFLGQGRLAGLPIQLLVVVAAATFFWLLVHRMTAGRVLRAIGWRTLAALGSDEDPRAFGCTHRLEGDLTVPL